MSRIITSYSIHYTKLYETYVRATVRNKVTHEPIAANIELVNINSRRESKRVQQADEDGVVILALPLVITSYSIHYTKLYDGEVDDELLETIELITVTLYGLRGVYIKIKV